MSEIVFSHAKKAYDSKKTVIEDLNLVISDGSFTVLVGPSGCGKSTTLRMIAGLEPLSAGELVMDGQRMNEVAPEDRDIAMVFQNFALYPTMTVRENIEFGLINKKIPREERQKLIADVVETVHLAEYLDKNPGELSGGQRQRVALARAMVKKPKVFLMDEPLSNLDARLRNEMRTELIELHKRLQTTFVYVTHDQTEAMSMATDIVLMHDGVIKQIDAPMKIYNDPNNIFAAQFIGTPAMNMFDLKKYSKQNNIPAQAKYIGFRPSRVHFTDEAAVSMDKMDFQGRILTHEFFGSEIIYRLQTDCGILSLKTFHKEELPLDMEVQVYVARKDCYFFDEKQNRVRCS
jgi:ABC-type sugar transport systems, ATPase components